MDWSALLTALGLIFVAELGDKTQLAVVAQTCKFRRPWAVFLGASAALVLVTLIGALGGRALSAVIPPQTLQTVAALAFVVMGGVVAREAYKLGRSEGSALVCEMPGSGDEEGTGRADWRAFAATFGLLFVAELGDKTQLAVLTLSSQADAVWPTFAGGAVALTLVTALGVIGGQGLCQVIPERLLLWISAAAFVVIGALMLIGVL